MRRLDNLQGLRTVAFIMIFLSHCGIGDLAGMAVTIFFVLSGFLMVYNYFSRDAMGCSAGDNLRFSYKKVRNLYSLHLLMILPTLVLTIYGGAKSGMINFHFALSEGLKLLSNALLIQAWIPERSFYFSYNGVAWFLSVCTFLYFIFPYINKRLHSNWSCKKAGLLIILSFFAQCMISVFVSEASCEWITEHINYITYIWPIYRVFDFIIGCNAGYLFLHVDRRHSVSDWCFTLLEAASVLLAFGLPLIVTRFGLSSILLSAKDMPGAAILIFVLGFNRGLVSKALSTRAMVALGNISGYTFLIHQVVINLCQIVIDNKYIVAVVAFVITVVAAYTYGWLNKARRARKV